MCTSETTNDYEFVFRSIKEGVENVTSEVYSPKVIVADAAHAIGKGFQNVFGENTIVKMCWAHVKMAIAKKARSLISEKTVKAEILSDIAELQQCSSSDHFDIAVIAVILFKEKWLSQPRFLLYFETEWIKKNKNWFEGVYSGSPSTNNSLRTE